MPPNPQIERTLGSMKGVLILSFTAASIAACAHTSSDSASRHVEEIMHRADKVVVVYVEPPMFYVMPNRTLGESMMGASAVPNVSVAALLFATGAGLHAVARSDPQRLRVVASLDVVSSVALSRYSDRVVSGVGELLIVRYSDPKFLEQYVGDLRTKSFPSAPIVVFQIDRWGVDRGEFKRFQLYYRVLARIYLDEQRAPSWEDSCLGTPTSPPLDSLTAERETYLADGGVLVNQQLRIAAQRCGEFFAQQFP